jgi:DNA-binding GntR family transcriptional regulator
MKKDNEVAPVELAYEFVRKRILSGEYLPGQPLLAKILASQIRVSRTPVQTALHRLQAEGLVTIRDRLGAIVKTMSPEEFEEMCELRLALESHAAGLAARNRTAADLQEIKYALDGMRKSTDEILAAKSEAPFLDELTRQDVHFHIAIMTAARNKLLKNEILRLHLINRVVLRRLNHETSSPGGKRASDAIRREVQAKHEEIFEAITKSDVRGAKQAMEEHIQDIIDKNFPASRTKGEIGQRKLTDAELVYSG